MIFKDTFVHHVHFWLNDKADLPKLIEGLNSLANISLIRDIHVGIPAATDRDVVERSHDASLLTFFNTQEEHDAYQVDADHQVFIDNYAKPLCAKVMVFDSVNA